MIIFYAVGFAEIVKWLAEAVFKWDFDEDGLCIKDEHNGSEKKKTYGWMNVLLIFGFFLAGGFIPLRESLLPKQVPEVTRAEICGHIDQVVEKGIYSNYRQSISEFCSSAKTKAIAGYAFYPRFFYTGEGYYTRPQDTRYGIQDYSRMVFRVIGQQSALVHIKTDRKDVPIQNKAIVYVLQRGEFREGAQLVVIINEEPSIVISSSILAGDDEFSFD